MSLCHPDRLNSQYIRAWCQEWDIAAEDLAIALEAYAMAEPHEILIGLLSTLALERRVQLHRAGSLTYVEEFISSELFSARPTPPSNPGRKNN